MSAATAYNHFPTKHTLIGHVLGPLVRPSVDRAQQRLANGEPVREILETHIRELTAITRERRLLAVPFVEAVQEYTIKVGGPPSPTDTEDPRNLAPYPVAITRVIAHGQASGVFRSYPPAGDLGASMTNLLLLRTFTRANEDASDTAEFILTVLFAALTPQLLVDAGADGRPFSTVRAAG